MADSYYRSQDATRYHGGNGGAGSNLDRWRSSVVSSGIPTFANIDMNVHMSKQDTGFAGLTCGPPNNELGSFELYVKGRKITLIYTITPDSTFTKYVLSTKSRSGEKHVFMDMRSLVRYCKIQAVELSNDDRDYEAIRDLEALRAAKSCESDICSEMGSLQLQEKRRRSTLDSATCHR